MTKRRKQKAKVSSGFEGLTKKCAVPMSSALQSVRAASKLEKKVAFKDTVEIKVVPKLPRSAFELTREDRKVSKQFKLSIIKRKKRSIRGKFKVQEI